jgi:uncharacterized protein YecE (DUF72 family)
VTNFRIGTSGWHYAHWRGNFYPEHLPAKDWFRFYAERFDTVELNNSFYHLPKDSAWRGWREEAPKGFTFSVKASRYITHMKRLTGGADPNERVLKGARMLGAHLGPVLYQLPPSFECDEEMFARLAAFLELLPADLDHVFEFRHASWFNEPVYDLLEKHGAHFCAFDMPALRTPLQVTGGLLYFRFHGSGRKYGGDYSRDELQRWSERFREAAKRGREAYVYFNNDVGGHAPRNATTLRELLDPT